LLFGAGGGCPEEIVVVVVVAVVVVVLVLVVLVLVPGVVLTVVVVGVDPVPFVCALAAADVGQDSVTEEIGGLTGSGIDESGVPGGTSTVNWSF
jgi:hypothetical protein